jgi:hypothetical protein
MFYDVTDPFSQGRIINAARTVSLRRPHIDHGIEFNPGFRHVRGIQVDPPQVSLSRSIFDHQRFLIGMKLASDGHEGTLNIDYRFDHVSELLLGQLAELRALDPVSNQVKRCRVQDFHTVAGEQGAGRRAMSATGSEFSSSHPSRARTFTCETPTAATLIPARRMPATSRRATCCVVAENEIRCNVISG